MKIQLSKKSILYIIPGIIVIWTFYLNFFLGPYYLRSIDPEYMYLVSGLNCATLDFNKIGHIDHPGTPLQLLTGLFFRVIHLFTGHSDIVTDVISDPELYLSLSSLMLTGITFFLLLRLGMMVYRYTSSILGALVLQASHFFTGVHFGILSRYSPDRLMTVIILLFFILYIKYLYDQKFNVLKFSILSGILMGAGLVTKYNFIPLLILPLVLIPGWRNRAYYFLSLIGSAFIFFLPVSSKINALWRILKDMIMHSGLYGSGDQGIIDRSVFFKNIALIFKNNPSFTIITLLGGLCILILVIKPKLRAVNKNGFLFLIASFLSIILGLVFTAKHYKGYYALPILSLIPMIFYTIIQLIESTVRFKYNTLSYITLFIILLLFPIITTARNFSGINTDLQKKRTTEAFIRDQISSEDYFIVTPTWMSTPMPENAMVLGVSYLHHRHLSYLDYERLYSNILTWEGGEDPLQHMRMRNANFEEVLLSGRGIHVYSKPGWNGQEVCLFIEHFAMNAGIRVQRDTVYSFEKIEEHIIRYRNIDGWKRTEDLTCGFEKQNQGQLLSDNERTILTGSFNIQEGIFAHGKNSILLESDMPRSPHFTLYGIKQGDVVSSTVKSNISNKAEIENILIKIEFTDINGNTMVANSAPSPGKINEVWYMSDLFTKIESQPADSSIRCYVEYLGNESVCLDDFTLKVYSQNP